MTRWERLEAWLVENNMQDQEFSHAAYMSATELSNEDATIDIQRYQRASWRKDSPTKFVLRRVAGTRTTNTIWHVGERTRDVREVGRAFHDDVRTTLMRVITPTERAIARHNPRAAKAVELQGQMMDHAVAMVALAAEGALDEREESSV